MATAAILGAGAIGQLLANLLIQAGHNAVVINHRIDQAEDRQHQFESVDGGISRITLEHRPNTQAWQPDLLLVTTKAYQGEQALRPVLEWLKPSTPIVLLHNGMGPQQRLANAHPHHSWWAGMLTDGALVTEPDGIRHTGKGIRFTGPLNDAHAKSRAIDALSAIGFESVDILPKLWQKLAVNAVINPLTVVLDCQNGNIAEMIHRPQVQALCEELTLVAEAEGQHWPQNQALDWVLTVANATASNSSSMRQDWRSGRQSELAAINGYLLECAEKHGLSLPTHQALVEAVANQFNR
ncbi:ketopantoate reductase family protein [Ferrimonas aestuarii]|uniref:2-dehydropantoate 2-reductase n=1 Tax=Ferrimonas aestuarii TaxID=2569539 RepID=A0A4V5NVJ4_9GAMM|nr:2-dehydropantoate 2-reductase [Ferrimonas aestuarii]TKB50839.1 2-dehydropantoate 2-reductase [Ferrimonas aestuarii]